MSVYECKQQKSLLGVALDLLNDGCPDETRMQLCGMENMDEAGEDPCYTCWVNFLFYVESGRKKDHYRSDRLREI